MRHTKGKRRGTRYVFAKPFRKHAVVLWPHIHEPIRKTSTEWVLFKKKCPTSVTMAKLEESTMLPACCWHCCKQTRARFLPRELMCILSTLSTLRAKIAS
ncbi:hypothetical protein AAY473_034528 [Plecturocebus cupreus]